jgi:hypothetical protein
MLLIYPPVSKPSEPPAGLAKLSAALKAHGIRHRAIDANIEGLLWLLNDAHSRPKEGLDTWTGRSLRNLYANLSSLKDLSTYRMPDRYKRAVKDLNRVIEFSSGEAGAKAGLSDFQQAGLSPVRSADLIHAAEHPEQNPFFPYFRDRLWRLFEESQPSFVGFSLNYFSQALTAFAMIGLVKKLLPRAVIILGGGLVTSWLHGPSWKNPFRALADHMVAGPGEDALLSIAGAASSGTLHVTPDYLPFCSNEYFAPGYILPYSASRGCYYRKCSFCPETAEENPYAPVATDRAITDLQSLVNERKPVLIHLLDNAISSSLMNSLAQNPPGAPWYGFARIGRQLTDLDFCASLRRSGCIMLKLGLESGDQDVLDRLQKGIDLGTASLALKTLNRAGIGTYVYLLFGTPEETETGARKTLDFVIRHSKEISFLNLAIFNMPVSTAVSRDFKRSSFYEGDLSLYTDFAHPSGWDRRAVRRFLEDEFKRDASVSSIIRKDPPFFTSNHAPFFLME